MNRTADKLQAQLSLREVQGNLRILHSQKELVDFCSNDYLGMARSNELVSSYLDKWKSLISNKELQLTLGATGSRLLTGNHALHESVEQKIAQYHGFEAGLLFNCGYMANLGLLSSLPKHSIVLYDIGVHASIYDGIKLSKLTSRPWGHNNLESLQWRLEKASKDEPIFVCIESIYSMDGTKAPLTAIAQLCAEYGANLIVDEAHAVGIYGKEGRGLVFKENLVDQVFAQVCTFSKALGVHGAIVNGSILLKQYLINFARSFMYTTAMPISALLAIQSAYELLTSLEDKRVHLELLSEYFQKRLSRIFKRQYNDFTHIQCLIVPGNLAVHYFASFLQSHGFHILPITSPTVKQGKECVRISLHTFNTIDEVSNLSDLINDFYNQRGI